MCSHTDVAQKMKGWLRRPNAFQSAVSTHQPAQQNIEPTMDIAKRHSFVQGRALSLSQIRSLSSPGTHVVSPSNMVWTTGLIVPYSLPQFSTSDQEPLVLIGAVPLVPSPEHGNGCRMCHSLHALFRHLQPMTTDIFHVLRGHFGNRPHLAVSTHVHVYHSSRRECRV